MHILWGRAVRMSVAAFGVLWITPLAATAESPHRARGLAAYEGARFADSQRAFEAVVADAASTREDLAEAFRYLVVLRVIQGQAEAAEEAALAAVSLRPAATAPEGSPPGVVALLDRARSLVPEGLSLSFDVPEAPISGTPMRVTATRSTDPARLGASIRLRCGEAEAVQQITQGETSATTSHLLQPGATGPGTCIAELLSQAGAILARAEGSYVARSAVAIGPGPGPHIPGPEPREERGGFPWLWVGVGAGAAAAATAIVLAVVLSQGSDEASLGAPVVVFE